MIDVQYTLPFEFDKEKKETTEGEREKGNLPYYEEPRTENQILLNLQWEFKNGNKNVLGPMYSRLQTIAMKYINKISQNNGHVKKMGLKDKEMKASDSASYIVEQYLLKDDFYIKSSMTGYLWLRVIHELFYQRKVDRIVDFVDLAEFYKEGTEDGDTEEI